MFEMFVLLIHEIHPHSFCFVTCFLFIFTREALPHRGLLHAIFCIAYLRICRGYLPQEFAAGICRGDLPQVFAVAICCQNLPWESAVGVCRGYFPWVFCIYKSILFCICEQILFIWRQTFLLCVQNFLICQIFFINSFSSCYCRGSYGPPQYSAFCITPFKDCLSLIPVKKNIDSFSSQFLSVAMYSSIKQRFAQNYQRKRSSIESSFACS